MVYVKVGNEYIRDERVDDATIAALERENAELRRELTALRRLRADLEAQLARFLEARSAVE